MNLNKVFVLGNLTRDPERRQLPSGQAVVNFGIATNRYYTNKEGEKKEDTEFHNIVIFGRTAEIADQYLKKGSSVLIEGRLKTSKWQDQASGQNRYRTEIIAERMQLGPKPLNQQGGSNWQANNPTPSPPPVSSNPGFNQGSQIRTGVKDEDIPIIEEGEPIKPVENLNNDSFAKDNEEIDVKDIPF